MKNTIKIFAAIMIMLTMLVTGCQSNEQKYAELKNDTIKTLDTMYKEIEANEKVSKAVTSQEKGKEDYELFYKKHMPKVVENLKKMEELSQKDVKLTNDLQMFKSNKTNRAVNNYKLYEKNYGK